MKTRRTEDPQSPLMKQLSKVLDAKVSRFNFSPELSLSRELLLGTPLFLEDHLVPWNHTELPSRQLSTKKEAKLSTVTLVASQNSNQPRRDPKMLQSSDSKRQRQNANSEILGRSHFASLLADHSPRILI